jgi:hypothetical protein
VDPPDAGPILELALSFALLEPRCVWVFRDNPLDQDLWFVAAHQIGALAPPGETKAVSGP